MEIDTGGLPEPSPSVEQGLKSVHPGLFIVRSRYQIDESTGQVRIDSATGKPIERPRYWVWIDHKGRKSPLFPIETPDKEYMPCDMRVVHRIGTDLGHVADTAEQMWALVQQHEQDKEDKRQAGEKERFRRFIESNGPAWREALENLRNGEASPQRRMRDPVIYGYDGQPMRGTRHGTIPVSAKERGIISEDN